MGDITRMARELSRNAGAQSIGKAKRQRYPIFEKSTARERSKSKEGNYDKAFVQQNFKKYLDVDVSIEYQEPWTLRKLFCDIFDRDGWLTARMLAIATLIHSFVMFWIRTLVYPVCALVNSKVLEKLGRPINFSINLDGSTRADNFVECETHRRLVMSVSGALHSYQGGVISAILDEYGDLLTSKKVSMEGMSGGACVAVAASSSLRGVHNMTFWMNECSVTATRVIASQPWYKKHVVAPALLDAADSFRRRFYMPAQSRLDARMTPALDRRLLSDGKVSVWATDASTMKYVQLKDLQPDNITEAILASAHVPFVMGPEASMKMSAHEGVVDRALDGGAPMFFGDYSVLNGKHRDGKEVRTLFSEVIPVVPQPKLPPNVRKLELWRWNDFRWGDMFYMHCPSWVQKMYLRAYYTTRNRRADEIQEAMDWLLE
jgi:hypothetical protein